LPLANPFGAGIAVIFSIPGLGDGLILIAVGVVMTWAPPVAL
jgi:hypothetical protein